MWEPHLSHLSGHPGHFHTRGAQAYPPDLCAVLAEAHLHGFQAQLEPPLTTWIAESLDFDPAPLPSSGERTQVPEVALCWDPIERWSLRKQWLWAFPEHNNLLEMRVAVVAAMMACYDPTKWRKRVMIISDSQCVIGCIMKGRSSVRPFNLLCRKLAGATLSTQIKLYLRYVRSERNVSDGPSRGESLGYAGGTKHPAKEPPKTETGSVEPQWDHLPTAFQLTKG